MLAPRAPELMRQIHTGDLICHALSRDLDRPVVLMPDGAVVTAGEMRASVSRYLQLFAAQGIGVGTVVGLLSRNRPEVLDLVTALRLAGCVFTALHPMGALDDFHYVVEDAGVEVLIFEGGYFDAMAASLDDRHSALRLLSIGPSVAAPDMLEASRAFQPGTIEAADLRNEDLVAIGYSGGTTGKPKGIAVSQLSADTFVTMQLTEWEWPDTPRHLVCSPLSHAGGTALIPVLLLDGLLVVASGADPVTVMTAIEQHRISSTMMVPTMIISMIDHPRLGEFDLSSLETLFYGASSFPAARLRDALKLLGPIFYQFYGQSEAPMCITHMRKAEHLVDDPVRLSSCGRPTPWVHLALLDDDGQPVADGVPGEICVRGPLLMSGYINKPEETAAAFASGWLHTGDVAVRDTDGFLRIMDRKKDMIVTGGFNVFAREVEDVLMEHDGVADAAVFGVPDPKWGEAVKAVIVRAAGQHVQSDELIALVKARKGAVQAPKRVEFVDAIPLSPLGKPDKKALRAREITPA